MNKNDAGPNGIFEKVKAYLIRHGAKKVAIFGSYARGEETSKSDLDVIVEFKDRKSIFDMVGMEQELSEDVGIKVELLTERSISPYLIDRIRKEMVVIHG